MVTEYELKEFARWKSVVIRDPVYFRRTIEDALQLMKTAKRFHKGWSIRTFVDGSCGLCEQEKQTVTCADYEDLCQHLETLQPSKTVMVEMSREYAKELLDSWPDTDFFIALKKALEQ